MSATFRIVALPAEPFAPLFDLDDAELAARGARRMVVDARPGYPCRVSLSDAEIGETVVLLPFVHHDVDTPYRASGPIFVRQGAAAAGLAPGEVPAMLLHRQLSLRAYDAGAMMVRSEVLEGSELEAAIGRCFADPQIAYLHVHNARPGCYNCRVERA